MWVTECWPTSPRGAEFVVIERQRRGPMLLLKGPKEPIADSTLSRRLEITSARTGGDGSTRAETASVLGFER